MKTFRFVCGKGGEKTELIVRYETLEAARHDLHTQGYTIIEHAEIEDHEHQNDKKGFYFETLVNGQKKVGHVDAEDPLRAYIKLVDVLHYHIQAMYEEKDATEDDKQKQTRYIQDLYKLYKAQHAGEPVHQEVKHISNKDATQKMAEADDEGINKGIKRELDRLGWLIDKAVEKVEGLRRTYRTQLSADNERKLTTIFEALKQAKNIANVERLKNIGETALVKIGEIEIELIRSTKTDQKSEILKNTNQLLKQFGSSKKVILEEDDLMRKLRMGVSHFFEGIFSPIAKRSKIDKKSFAYYKVLREMGLYKKKLKETNIGIAQAYARFDFARAKVLRMKRKLILQNIQIIHKRITERSFSYTRIVKGLQYYQNALSYLFRSLGDAVVWAMLGYAVLYILFRTGSDFGIPIGTFNYASLVPVSFLMFIGASFRLSRNLVLMALFSASSVLFGMFILINF